MAKTLKIISLRGENFGIKAASSSKGWDERKGLACACIFKYVFYSSRKFQFLYGTLGGRAQLPLVRFFNIILISLVTMIDI